MDATLYSIIENVIVINYWGIDFFLANSGPEILNFVRLSVQFCVH